MKAFVVTHFNGVFTETLRAGLGEKILYPLGEKSKVKYQIAIKQLWLKARFVISIVKKEAWQQS